MIWELLELERRRTEIEAEIKALGASRQITGRKRTARIAELSREDSRAFVRRQQLLSAIGRDRQLSKALDQERSRPKAQPVPEAQSGVAETAGQLTPAQAQRIKLQARQKAWHEKSVTERNIEVSLLLEQERDAGWERD